MKKLAAWVLCAVLLCALPCVLAENYLDTGEEGTFYYAPVYGLALVDEPSLYEESPHFIVFGVMDSDEETKAAAVYAELIVLGDSEDGNPVVQDNLLFGMAIVGMEGDLSPEDARKAAGLFSLDFDAFTEEQRLDGHNIYYDSTYLLIPSDEPSDELSALIAAYQAELPRAYSGFVNINRAKVAEVLAFSGKDFSGDNLSAAEVFAQSDYTLVEVTAACYGDVCIPQASELQGVCTALGEDRVQLVLICMDAYAPGDGGATEQQKLLENAGLKNLCFLYSDEINEQIPVTGFPTTLVVDGDGTVISEYPGGTDDTAGYLGWLSELGIN